MLLYESKLYTFKQSISVDKNSILEMPIWAIQECFIENNYDKININFIALLYVKLVGTFCKIESPSLSYKKL